MMWILLGAPHVMHVEPERVAKAVRVEGGAGAEPRVEEHCLVQYMSTI